MELMALRGQSRPCARPPQRQCGGRPVGPIFLRGGLALIRRSEEHTSELQSLMRISYAVFCLKKKKQNITPINTYTQQKTPKYKCKYYKTYTMAHRDNKHRNTKH